MSLPNLSMSCPKERRRSRSGPRRSLLVEHLRSRVSVHDEACLAAKTLGVAHVVLRPRIHQTSAFGRTLKSTGVGDSPKNCNWNFIWLNILYQMPLMISQDATTRFHYLFLKSLLML